MYNAEQTAKAKARFEAMSEDERAKIVSNLLMGLPGTTSNAYTLENFQAALDVYKGMSSNQLRDNLAYFLAR